MQIEANRMAIDSFSDGTLFGWFHCNRKRYSCSMSCNYYCCLSAHSRAADCNQVQDSKRRPCDYALDMTTAYQWPSIRVPRSRALRGGGIKWVTRCIPVLMESLQAVPFSVQQPSSLTTFGWLPSWSMISSSLSNSSCCSMLAFTILERGAS